MIERNISCVITLNECRMELKASESRSWKTTTRMCEPLVGNRGSPHVKTQEVSPHRTACLEDERPKKCSITQRARHSLLQIEFELGKLYSTLGISRCLFVRSMIRMQAAIILMQAAERYGFQQIRKRLRVGACSSTCLTASQWTADSLLEPYYLSALRVARELRMHEEFVTPDMAAVDSVAIP